MGIFGSGKKNGKKKLMPKVRLQSVTTVAAGVHHAAGWCPSCCGCLLLRRY